MARRPVPPPKPRSPILTAGQKRHRIERLQKCITSLEAFDHQKARKRFGNPEVVTLEAAIDKALSSAFGYGTPVYMRYNLAATLNSGAFIPDAAQGSGALGRVGGPARHEAQTHEARQHFTEGKERSIRLLREAICTLEGEIADAQPVVEVAQQSRGVADVDHSPPGDGVAKSTPKAGEVRALQPRRRGSIDLKAAWRRVERWWRGRN
jgi:hypothetical protein